MGMCGYSEKGNSGTVVKAVISLEPSVHVARDTPTLHCAML